MQSSREGKKYMYAVNIGYYLRTITMYFSEGNQLLLYSEQCKLLFLCFSIKICFYNSAIEMLQYDEMRVQYWSNATCQSLKTWQIQLDLWSSKFETYKYYTCTSYMIQSGLQFWAELFEFQWVAIQANNDTTDLPTCTCLHTFTLHCYNHFYNIVSCKCCVLGNYDILILLLFYYY